MLAENLLQRRVDDRILKLRRVETVPAADFGEIVEPDRQRHLARLQLFAAQLADQPRRLAQRKRQRRLVIRLVIRQRGVAGNRRAVLHFQQQRLVPQAVGEQPELRPPDAEFLPEQRRRQFRHVAKRLRAERRQRALPVLADAGKLAHGTVLQKFLFLARLDFDETGLGRVRRQFGQPRGIGQTGGHGNSTSREMRSQISPDVIFRRRVAPDHLVHRREIQKAFVNRDGHERRRIFLQDVEHLRRKPPVFVVMRTAQNAARTKPLRLEARHAGLDAEFFGRAVGGDDDAVAAPAAADPDRPALQFRFKAISQLAKKLSPSTCRMRMGVLAFTGKLYFNPNSGRVKSSHASMDKGGPSRNSVQAHEFCSPPMSIRGPGKIPR